MSDIVLTAGVRANLLQLQSTAATITNTQSKLGNPNNSEYRIAKDVGVLNLRRNGEEWLHNYQPAGQPYLQQIYDRVERRVYWFVWRDYRGSTIPCKWCEKAGLLRLHAYGGRRLLAVCPGERSGRLIAESASPAHPVLCPSPSRQWLIHGSGDDTVPPDFSRDYVSAKQKRPGKEKEDVHLLEIAGAGHIDLIDPRTPAWKRVEEIVLQLAA